MKHPMLYVDIKKEFDKVFLGFTKMFDSFDNTPRSNYPPYNVRNYQDGSVRVEIACAGFAQNELSVQHNSSKVFIKGEKLTDDSSDGFVHRGIAARDFELVFDLAPDLTISNAEYNSGLLTIICKPIAKYDNIVVPINPLVNETTINNNSLEPPKNEINV